MKRVTRLTVLFAALLPLVFSACPGGKTSGGTESSIKVRETGDVTLTFLMWGSPEENKSVAKILKQFQKENEEAKKKDPKVKLIGLKVITVDSLNYSDKLQAMFAGDTPPDVFYLHIQDFYKYASRDQLYDLNEFITADNYSIDDFYPELIKAFTFGDGLYGIPKDWTSFVLYYNMDLFKKYNIAAPTANWTWDDFLKAAKTLTVDENNDGIIDRYGFTIETWADWYYSWIMQNGGEVFDKNGSWVFAKGEYINKNAEAIQFLADMINVHKVAPDITTSRQLGNYESFMAGRVAMCIYGRWAELKFKDIQNFKWAYAPLPKKQQNASTVVTVALSIAGQTKQPDASWELLKFLTSKEGQVFTAETGLAVPSRKSLVSSKSYLEAPEVIKYQEQLKMTSPDNDPFITQLKYGKLPPNHPKWLEVRQKMDEQLEGVWLGKEEAKGAILRIDKIASEILADSQQEDMVGDEE